LRDEANRILRAKEPQRETMNKHTEESDSKNHPPHGRKNNPLTSWGAVVALLGAGALPCPECGMPLAWHLWPLALLILAARWIARRTPACPTKPDASLPRDDSETPQED
jgi:hypothetical protein